MKTKFTKSKLFLHHLWKSQLMTRI